jgi:hypothetical protein
MAMRYFQVLFLALLLVLFFSTSAQAQGDFVVMHRIFEDNNAARHQFILEMVKLSLEETRPKYGNYRLEAVPTILSLERARYELKRDTYSNLFITAGGIEGQTDNNLITIDFPVDLGILGYRVCFVNPQLKEKIGKVTSLKELRKYSIGQGTGWPDNAILKHNGFHVIEVPLHSSLLKMVASGRVDLFCRGINELKDEYDLYHQMGNLVYDESFALVYPFKWNLYLNKNSVLAKERIEAGLKIAHANGSLKRLWLKYYKDNVAFANLKSRHIYYLKPLIPLPTDYTQYFIDPLALN